MLRLNLGDLLTWRGEEYVVAAARPHTAMLRRIAGNDTVWIDIVALADELIVTDPVAPPATDPHGTGKPANEDGDALAVLGTLTGEELAAARWWVPHLNEVISGVPDPDDASVLPRSGYETGRKTDRRALKVLELNAAGHKVSARSLRRKERQYLLHGVHGLVDRRALVAPQAIPSVDDRIREAVLAVLAATNGTSTVSVTTLIDKARAYVAQRYRGQEVEFPSARTMRRVFAAYDHRGLATGKATSRRSEANRHDRGPRPVAAVTPGQVVEIDSTPVNVWALMSDGKPGRVHLTVAVDVATRSILAFDIVPVSTSGVEHADLLARILRPRQCRPGAPDYLRLDKSQTLPGAAMIAADERQRGALALPYIVPETITTDRGRDYLSETFVSACRHFGISVVQAPPHSPTFKGHVERVLGTIDTMWMQKQPGYVGNSVANRGEIDLGELRTVGELQESFEEWWVRVYQNRPHSELRDRDVPSRMFTPNQMYAALFDAGAGIPVPLDQGTYIALMPVERRTIQNDGIHVDNLTYWHDDLPRLRKLTPPTRDGKWEVRKDPYDNDRVWVQDPKTNQWLECISESYRLASYPFASALRLLRSTPPVDDAAGEAWAVGELGRQTALKDRTKGRNDEKRRAVLARQRRDEDPRPGRVSAPDPAPADPTAITVRTPGHAAAEDQGNSSPGDFALVRTGDRLWND